MIMAPWPSGVKSRCRWLGHDFGVLNGLVIKYAPFHPIGTLSCREGFGGLSVRRPRELAKGRSMETETTFRIAVGMVIVFATSIAIIYRMRAASGAPAVSRRQEGLLIGVTLRVGGLVLWLSTIAYLVAPSVIQFANIPIPRPIRWIGVVTAVIGLGWMRWTLASLGSNLTDTVETRHNATLVTDGPYRWVRHPYYVAAAILILATTLITTNLLIGLSGFVVLVMLAIRTPQEEQMLLQRFGDKYQAYQARTGRFIPQWRPPAD